MKHLIACLALCLIAGTANASSPTPAENLKSGISAATAFYDQKKYAEADAAMDKLAADPEIVALNDWPAVYYNWACSAALAGNPDKAIALLQKGVAADAQISPSRMIQDSDLASLREDPRFKALVVALRKKAALWDSPALVTRYKPVLSEAEKVAGLSKIWSMARYNFAFFDRLPDLDWDKLYMEYLPKVQAAKTTAAYYRVLMEFATELHDGHTGVYPPKELRPVLQASTPLNTLLIEGKVLVTRVIDPALKGIGVGDEIVAVDGMPTRGYAEKFIVPIAPGFTKQDIEAWTYNRYFLMGDRSKPVHLTLRHADGSKTTLTVKRNGEDFDTNTDAPSFKMLPGGIAYLAVNTMSDDSGIKCLREHFAEIEKAKGLIIDIRENGGGNSSNGYAVLAVIADKPFFGSNARTRAYVAAERAWGNLPGWKTYPADTNPPDEKMHYDGPVAVLISGRSFSAAEDFAVAFDTMKRGTLIGETTAGSTGQPIKYRLPGGGGGRVCTKNDSYADGTVFEGVGVKPQIPVAPTVTDFRAGKDTVLERAVEFLKTGK